MKKPSTGARGVLIWIALAGCAQPAKNSRPELRSTLVGDSIAPSPGWLESVAAWHINSPMKSYSIQLDPSMKVRGENTLRFELREGDAWIGPKGSKTFRAELVPSDFPAKESVRFYACNLFIPRDFPMEDNRLVLMQWWPQTKTELGEVGRSPSMALRYSEGRMTVDIRHSDLHVVKNADTVPRVKVLSLPKFPRGLWHRFVFQVKWSFRKGFAKIWLDGKPVADYEGPVGYDDAQGPLFKFGMYRDDSPKTYVTYFNGCREGATRQAVRGAKRE